MSLCCHGALSMTDRWVCGRKVRGALEVAVELWERRGGWLGGCEHRSDSRSHRAIHTNGLMHRKICSSVDSVLTRMHLHTQHKSAESGKSFSLLPFCAGRICSSTFRRALGDTHTPVGLYSGWSGAPVRPPTTGQLDMVIIT